MYFQFSTIPAANQDRLCPVRDVKNCLLQHISGFRASIHFKDCRFLTFSINKRISWFCRIFKKNFSKENIYVFARETFSYNLLRNEYSLKNAYLTKDIVLYLKDDMRIEKNSHKEDILLCLRNDVEKDISVEDINILTHELSKEFNISFTDTVLERKIKDKDRENEVLKKIQEFSKYKYVITDRLHGMIFAVLAKVPCFILNNYNYKVKGVYQSIKDDENVFIIDNVNNISKIIKNTKMKEKCDKIYLYCQVMDRIDRQKTGELFFYYIPK